MLSSECKMGLKGKAIALVLSHHRIGLVGKGVCSSLRIVSKVLKRATLGCFLTYHKIGLAPKKIYRHKVDFLVSKQAAESVSEKSLIVIIMEGLK